MPSHAALLQLLPIIQSALARKHASGGADDYENGAHYRTAAAARVAAFKKSSANRPLTAHERSVMYGPASGEGLFSALKSAASTVSSAAQSAAAFIQAHLAETAKALAMAQTAYKSVTGGARAHSGHMDAESMEDYEGGAAYVKKYHNKHGNLVRSWGTHARKAAAASNPWIKHIRATQKRLGSSWQEAMEKGAQTYAGPSKKAGKKAAPGLAKYNAVIKSMVEEEGMTRKEAVAQYKKWHKA